MTRVPSGDTRDVVTAGGTRGTLGRPWPSLSSAATRRRAAAFSVLHEISMRVAASLDLDETLRAVTRAAQELLDADIAALFLLDEEGQRLRLRAVLGQRSRLWEGLELELHGGVNAQALAAGAPRRTDDIGALGNRAEAVRRVSRDEPVTSVVAAPLVVQGRALGTVSAFRRELRPFDDEASALLGMVADQAALALAHAMQHADLETARQRLHAAHSRSAEALREVARHAAMDADLPAFFGHLTRTIAGLTGASRVAFAKLHAGGWLQAEPNAHGFDDATLAAQRLRCVQGGTGIIDQLVFAGRVIRARSDDPRLDSHRDLIETLGMADLLAVPWRAGDEPLGMLVAADSTRDGGFTDEDALVMVIAAESAGLVWKGKLAEQELARHAQEVDDISRARTDFMNIVVHELRRPMTVVSGYTAMLIDGTLGTAPPGWEQPLRIIYEQGDAMRQLIDDLLLAARLEAGLLPVTLKLVDLRDAARDALRRAGSRADLLGARVVNTAPDEPVYVETDTSHLSRILDNLVANALVYGGDSPYVGVHVTAGPTPAILVEDHGAGVPEDARQRIFERFYRVTDRTAHAGSGLGLYISRQLAQQMGGDVELTTTGPARGSVFSVRLPAASEAASTG